MELVRALSGPVPDCRSMGRGSGFYLLAAFPLSCTGSARIFWCLAEASRGLLRDVTAAHAEAPNTERVRGVRDLGGLNSGAEPILQDSFTPGVEVRVFKIMGEGVYNKQ